jgi:hypothetical protein
MWTFYFSELPQSIRTYAHRATMNTNIPSKCAWFFFPWKSTSVGLPAAIERGYLSSPYIILSFTARIERQ